MDDTASRYVLRAAESKGGSMSDILDTRDLAERLDELEDTERAYQASAGLPMPEAPLSEEEYNELSALRKLADEIGDEWQYGVTLVPDADFADYAREYAEDCGLVTGTEIWPLTCIDWECAARELQADYSLITFEGIDYWYA